MLEEIVSACDVSYYRDRLGACHIDLVPFATANKWGQMPLETQKVLLRACAGMVGSVIRESGVSTLILNGRSVVRQFQALSNVELVERLHPAWDLPRMSSSNVLGMSYRGYVREIGGVSLGRSVEVLGYNHNLQSSFGVSRSTVEAIASWIRYMVVG